MRRILILAIFFISTATAFAQYGCLFAEAFAEQDISAWHRTLEMLNKEPDLLSDSTLSEAKLFGLYGAVAWYIRFDEITAEVYADKLGEFLTAIDSATTLRAQKEMMSVAYYYFKAYLNPWISPYYVGKAIIGMSNTSPKTESQPYYWTELGNTKYHVPGYLGRDYQASAAYYRKSRDLFISNGDTTCNWYFLNTMLWLARSYQKGHNVKKSLEVYREIISYQPNFDTVNRIIHILEKDSTVRF